MSNTRRRRKGLSQAGVAAGLAATLLAGGVAVAAGEAPALASSSKIYACYSDTTGALSHLDYPTVKKCPSGGTLISWNASGPQGSRGAKGSQGAKGAQGAEGAQGARGAAGPQGAQGGAGPQGPRGAQGATGSNGPQGSAGPQGSTGPQGAPGTKGAQGSAGTRGAQGAPGAQGPAGPVAGVIARGQVKLATGLLKGVPTAIPQVVASFRPGIGDYAVNAAITGEGVIGEEGGGAEFSCWARDKSMISSPSGGLTSTIESQTSTQATFALGGKAATAAVDGVLSPWEGSATIQLVCEVQPYQPSLSSKTYPGSAYVRATMMATSLTTATATGSASIPPRNRFHKAVKRQASGKPSDAGT
jgi:hypothetical protein